MRRIIGWISYFVGGGLVILSVHTAINCEMISAFSRVENYRFDFWQFIYHTSGNHGAYPNGYFLHWMRDLAMLLSGILVIRLGREQFVLKPRKKREKPQMIECPGCRRKTFADAYCRFCGFNLVTYQPSREGPVLMPVWKVSLYAYGGVSLLLLLLNLLLIRLQLP